MKKEILIIFFLLILSFVFIYNFFRLNKEYRDLIKEINLLVNQKTELEKNLMILNNTLIELINNYTNLHNNYEDLRNRYEILYKNHSEIYNSYLSLKDQLEIYAKNKVQIQEYILSNVNYDFSKENFISSIKNYCISGKTLNYPCLIEILKSKFGFFYKELEWFKDEVNISNFIKFRYGDCKSWSLFSIAIIKYFYKKGEINRLKLYYNYPGEKFILYFEGNTYFYYPNSKEYIINLDNFPNFYVICYHNLTGSSGHCISGLSDILINPNNYNYTNFLLFEPQTGEYLGSMREFLSKNNNIMLTYIFSDNGHFYHRPLYLIQWSNELWIWI